MDRFGRTVGCVAVATHPSVIKANVTAGLIKAGTVVAGVTGLYPSATYPLPQTDGYLDLDSASFNAQIKSATPFAWFDRSGVRYTGAGDVDLVVSKIKDGVDIFGNTGTFAPPCAADGGIDCLTNAAFKAADMGAFSTWDIRGGKSVAGVAGSIYFYRNQVDLNRFNQLAGVGASTSTTVADFHDTIDDLNNGGAFPTNIPTGFVQATGANFTRDAASDTGGGGGVIGNGLCEGAEDCVYKDNISGQMWTKATVANPNWFDANDYCENVNYGTYTDWRLPTIKELMQVYIDGIWANASQLGVTHSQYWSSTTISEVLGNAWIIDLSNATLEHQSKFNGYLVVCTRQ